MPCTENDTDEKLFHSIAAQQEDCFAILFHKYKMRFFSVALKMTGSHVVAEEMVQEVFLKLWQNKHTLHQIEKPESYLFTILYRLIFKYFKKKALEQKLFSHISKTASFQNNVDESVLANDSHRLINEAVKKLPAQQQLVFRLARAEGLSRDEIATHLNISPNTVRNHLADATKSVKNYLQKATMLFFL